MSGDDGLRLYCVSNSSQSGVGTITASNGDMFNIGSNGIWNVAYSGNRPGFLRLQNRIVSNTPMLLTVSTQGIYTCTIPDDEGNDITLNVGLYPNDFNSKYNYIPDILYTAISPTTVLPTIMDMEYDEDSRRVRCISTGSPATNVTWMKDGVIIDESSTDYTLTQTVTNRATSTYTNIVTVNVGAPGGVAGIYICTVTNDLGTATNETVAYGELMVDVKISGSYPTLYISGITISGLETPLIVGQSAATISCMTNIAVNSIEWRNQSSLLIISNAGDLMELQYTIDLVTDDLHGQQFTCIAISDTTTYNEIVTIQVQGITIL